MDVGGGGLWSPSDRRCRLTVVRGTASECLTKPKRVPLPVPFRSLRSAPWHAVEGRPATFEGRARAPPPMPCALPVAKRSKSWWSPASGLSAPGRAFAPLRCVRQNARHAQSACACGCWRVWALGHSSGISPPVFAWAARWRTRPALAWPSGACQDCKVFFFAGSCRLGWLHSCLAMPSPGSMEQRIGGEL